MAHSIEQTLQAKAVGEANLFAEHVQRFTAQMDRVQASFLGSDPARSSLPIQRRLIAYYEHPERDPALARPLYAAGPLPPPLQHTPWRSASQPAGDMDRNHPSSLERGLPPEHQPTDELLACREGRTPRDRRGTHGLGREHRTPRASVQHAHSTALRAGSRTSSATYGSSPPLASIPAGVLRIPPPLGSVSTSTTTIATAKTALTPSASTP